MTQTAPDPFAKTNWQNRREHRIKMASPILNNENILIASDIAAAGAQVMTRAVIEYLQVLANDSFAEEDCEEVDRAIELLMFVDEILSGMTL